MAKLSAAPDVPEPEPAGGPPDWPDLRASFVLGMRAAHRSPATIRTYLEGADAFAAFLAERSPGRTVEATTRDDLRAFLVELTDRGCKPATVATRHSGLRALFRFLTDEEIITQNPMAAIPTPQVTEERVPPALTDEQVARLVKGCPPRSTFLGARDRALILLLSSSGIRASECLGLEEADLVLDSEAPYVVVRGKGDRIREAACSHEAALAVQAYLRVRRKHRAAHRPELWLTYNSGAGLTNSGLLRLVREAGRRAGVDVHTHALRHTATDHMLRRGMGEHNVATQLGHKSLKMLGRYGRARAAERSRDDFFRSQER